MERYYGYNDIFILPQYSEVKSRKYIDTSVTIGNLQLQIPVISSNMDTVTDANMAIKMYEYGAIGALHRFMSVEKNVKEYEVVKNAGSECFVSIGVNRDSKTRAEELYKAGARYFIIDIAHGHSKLMKDTLEWIKNSFKDIFVVAGNVGTQEAIVDLESWGADCIKVGLSGGKVCTTKDVTGVETPMFTTIQKCTDVANVPIIADGGIRSSGDVCKAIGAGASLVMIGYLLAQASEAPNSVDNKKIYRGMASEQAMMKIRANDEYIPTPEGTEIDLKDCYPLEMILKSIQGGLRSSFSYSNATNLKDYQQKVKFGLKNGSPICNNN